MTVANVGASADNVFTTSVANAASLSGHVLVSCRAGPPGPPSGGPLPGACSGWAQRSGGRRGPSQPLLLAARPASAPGAGGVSAHAPPCLLPASGPAPGAFGPRRPCRPTAQPCAMRPGAAHPVPLCAASAPSEPSVALYGQGLSGLGGTACFQGARWGGRPQKVDCPWGLGWTVEVPFGLDGTAGTQGARWQSSRLSNGNKQNAREPPGGGGRGARGPCECEGFVRVGHSRAGGFLPVAPPWQQVPPCQSVSQDRGPGEGCACSPCLGGGCPQARAGRDTPSQWRAAGLSVRLRRGGLPGLWAPARVRAVGAPQRYGELPLDP